MKQIKRLVSSRNRAMKQLSDIMIVRQSWNSLTHWHTQPAVRQSEPSMSFAFNSSLLSVDGMTCLLPFES
jgi:hypothetical protein